MVICLYIHLYVCMYVYKFVCVYVRTCVCMYYAGMYVYTGGPPYPRVIRSKFYCGDVKLRIIQNAIYTYNVI